MHHIHMHHSQKYTEWEKKSCQKSLPYTFYVLKLKNDTICMYVCMCVYIGMHTHICTMYYKM